MTNKPIFLRKSDIARSFSGAAKAYDRHAFIQQEIGTRLLERLDIFKISPTAILDVGAGTGFLTRQLQQKFPTSHIIGLDLAQGMTQYAKTTQPWHLWKQKPSYVCGDMENLPFADKSFDLIFSNFTLQWGIELAKVFKEFNRVLKPNGLLLFSTLGPQTLIELRQSWAYVDNSIHVNEFCDMHDIGDLLLNTPLGGPVIDMEMLTITYSRVHQLLQDLKATGAHNMNTQRAKGCTSGHQLARMLHAYEAFKLPDNTYPATFEIIYGHAWQMQKREYAQDKDGFVRIPADKIPLRNTVNS